MAASDETNLVNGLTFLENLIRVPTDTKAYPTPVFTWIFGTSGLMLHRMAGSNAAAVDAFFASLNKSTNPLPTTFDAFITKFQTFLQTAGTYNYGIMAGVTEPFSDYFLRDYVTFTSSDANVPNVTGQSGLGSNDWSLITPRPDKANLTAQFKAWFADALINFSYNTDGTVPSTVSSFFDRLSRDLTITAGLMNGSNLFPLVSTSLTTAQLADLPRYQDVYEAFFPTGNFAARLNQFYQEQIAEKGYFIPSNSFDKWTAQILQDVGKTLAVNPFAPSSLSSANFHKTLVLNRIYELIADLLGTLQSVTAAQANRLFILSQWQRAYTNSLSQIHTFLQGDGTFLAEKPGDSDDVKKAKTYQRGRMNDAVNSNWTTLIQNNRSVVGDDAKALQSNVNQSNDAVSQQANMATAIIQELNTLLGAIFR
ncbi:MAG: hypothetical protein H0X51_03160 [Parachlamydiaceae bacterium]|nr:hypothetical protein [Parachlamydiaceae bacterium]